MEHRVYDSSALPRHSYHYDSGAVDAEDIAFAIRESLRGGDDECRNTPGGIYNPNPDGDLVDWFSGLDPETIVRDTSCFADDPLEHPITVEGGLFCAFKHAGTASKTKCDTDVFAGTQSAFDVACFGKHYEEDDVYDSFDDMPSGIGSHLMRIKKSSGPAKVRVENAAEEMIKIMQRGGRLFNWDILDKGREQEQPQCAILCAATPAAVEYEPLSIHPEDPIDEFPVIYVDMTPIVRRQHNVCQAYVCDGDAPVDHCTVNIHSRSIGGKTRQVVVELDRSNAPPGRGADNFYLYQMVSELHLPPPVRHALAKHRGYERYAFRNAPYLGDVKRENHERIVTLATMAPPSLTTPIKPAKMARGDPLPKLSDRQRMIVEIERLKSIKFRVGRTLRLINRSHYSPDDGHHYATLADADDYEVPFDKMYAKEAFAALSVGGNYRPACEAYQVDGRGRWFVSMFADREGNFVGRGVNEHRATAENIACIDVITQLLRSGCPAVGGQAPGIFNGVLSNFSIKYNDFWGGEPWFVVERLDVSEFNAKCVVGSDVISGFGSDPEYAIEDACEQGLSRMQNMKYRPPLNAEFWARLCGTGNIRASGLRFDRQIRRVDMYVAPGELYVVSRGRVTPLAGNKELALMEKKYRSERRGRKAAMGRRPPQTTRKQMAAKRRLRVENHETARQMSDDRMSEMYDGLVREAGLTSRYADVAEYQDHPDIDFIRVVTAAYEERGPPVRPEDGEKEKERCVKRM
jgi:hypothetical protein